MKRTKKMMLVTLMATTAIAMMLMSRALAAPAGTCPTANLQGQYCQGGTCPTSGSLLNQLCQNGTCPTSAAQLKLLCPGGRCTVPNGSISNQTLQQLLSKYGISIPGYGTGTPAPAPAPTPAPAPKPTPAPAPTPTQPPVTNPPATGKMSADEQKMINLVNQDRAANGLKPLVFDSTLRAPALLHSQDMSQNNYFSHTSPTYGTFSDRLKASGVKYSTAGENIAMYGSVEAAEVGFMNSPGHRANILNTNYTRIGIGIVYNQSRGSYYISQWFAG